MFCVKEILDLNSSEVEVYSRLTESALRADGTFIAESVPVIESALDAGYEPISMLMERRHLEGKANAVARRCGVTVYTADDGVLEKLTGYALTRGVLCAFKRGEQPSARTVADGARRLCVLEGITDSTNVGAVFRSAAALGTDAVLLSRCCDPLCRRSIRVSMGTVFKVPWARLSVSAAEAAAQLRSSGFAALALALADGALPLDSPPLKTFDKTAVFIGSEGSGLSAGTVAACSHAVRIPMSRGVDSLNAAAASAVAFWELFRRA